MLFWPGMHAWGLGRSEPCSLCTKMRMFPPPWNDCSWTVSALCPCRDRACLLQSSPRAENCLRLPALYFRKVPTEGARPLPLWLQTQCPWFLVGHSVLWDDNQGFLATASLLPCSPGLSPSQVYHFCDSPWACFTWIRKIKTPLRIVFANTHGGWPG